MLKVYTAGAMTGIPVEEQKQWRKELKDKLNLHSSFGIQCIHPNEFYNFEQVEYDSNEEVFRFDIRLLKSCDIVVVNLNHYSVGTIMEIAIAYENNIPIIGYCDNYNDALYTHPWIKVCVDKMFVNKSLDDVASYISRFYGVFK